MKLRHLCLLLLGCGNSSTPSPIDASISDAIADGPVMDVTLSDGGGMSDVINDVNLSSSTPPPIDASYGLIILSLGASTCAGSYQTSVTDSAPPGCTVLFDDAGTYLLDGGGWKGMYLEPLHAGPRIGGHLTPGNGTIYPAHPGGENPDVTATITLSDLWLARYSEYLHIDSEMLAQGGENLAPMMRDGGPYATNAYASILNTVKQVCRLLRAEGRACLVPFAYLIIGEIDTADPWNAYPGQLPFRDLLVIYQNELQTDLQTITGQEAGIPMLLSQVATGYFWDSGIPGKVWGAASAIDEQRVIQAYPDRFIGTFTKSNIPRRYWYKDGVHFVEHRNQGDKEGEIADKVLRSEAFMPFVTEPPTFNGNVVDVPVHIPVPPFVSEPENRPHELGTTFGDHGEHFPNGPGWTGCNAVGGECWNGAQPIPCLSADILINGPGQDDTIVRLTCASIPTMIAFGFTPDGCYNSQVPGTYCDLGPCPEGHCTVAHDSSHFVGHSKVGTQQDGGPELPNSLWIMSWHKNPDGGVGLPGPI